MENLERVKRAKFKGQRAKVIFENSTVTTIKNIHADQGEVLNSRFFDKLLTEVKHHRH